MTTTTTWTKLNHDEWLHGPTKAIVERSVNPNAPGWAAGFGRMDRPAAVALARRLPGVVRRLRDAKAAVEKAAADV